MNISQNTVVLFHYTLKDESGSELETTTGHDPITYLHGHNNLLNGIETALEGKATGDNLSVTLEPEQAFGEVQPESKLEVPVEHLLGADSWEPGMVAVVNTSHGQRQVKVMTVEEETATIDTNHPLAGKTLIFDLEVVEVRDASAEEIEHGHVHGEGGEHH